MIDALDKTFDLVGQFYLEGFVAGTVAALAGGIVGIRLTLRRMPLAGLAAPQLAALGTAVSFLLVAQVGDEIPDLETRAAVAALTVGFGMTSIVFLARRRHRAGAVAGLIFVMAWAGARLVAAIAPQRELAETLNAEGRMLSVTTEGRDLVVLMSILVLAILVIGRRAFDAAAFDPDQARIARRHPRFVFLVEVIMASLYVAITVPIIGAEAVLSFLFVPAAFILPVAPRLALTGPLAAGAACLGVVGAFHLAVSMDWPLGCSVTVAVVIASALVAGIAWLAGLLR